VPTLCSLLGVLVNIGVLNILPELLNQMKLAGLSTELIIFAVGIFGSNDLPGIVVPAFTAAVIATFIQRSIALTYRGLRGREYKEKSKEELL